MTIQVYNTLTRTKESFQPLVPGRVGMYVCGPTVYSQSHVGHMVGPVIFDTIKRYLTYCGYRVTLVINITDIDDKIIAQAAREGCSVESLAERVTNDYLHNLARLDVHVDHFPRATAYIDQIQEIIRGLIERGFAYAAVGDVYFEVTKCAQYGKLSNRRLDELLAGTRKEVNDAKRHPGDFALWKAAKPGEPAWESPWGPGRPGWHIECSAMSMKLLGPSFDIHGGGLDLCFPHHEDEIAQSESFNGRPFARYWMHNGLMQYGDETRKIGARENDLGSQEQAKMSKSKGNVITITELLDRHSPETVRFFLLATHYRRPIYFTDERIEEVGRGLGRLYGLCERIERVLGEPFCALAAPTQRADLAAEPDAPFLAAAVDLRSKFLDFMDDDFNTGGAVGVLFDLANLMNRFADEQRLEESISATSDREAFRLAAIILRELSGILGVLANRPSQLNLQDALAPKLLDLLMDVRRQLRQSKQFAIADEIRNVLNKIGVAIEDRADGTYWKIRD